MQRLEVSGAVRPIYGSLGVKRLRYIQLVVYIKTFNVNSGIPLEKLVECILITLFLVGLMMTG